MSGDAEPARWSKLKLKQLEREGKKVDEKTKKKELYESVRATYEHQNRSTLRPARSGSTPSSIPPIRATHNLALESAALNPEIRGIQTGVLAGPDMGNVTDRVSTRIVAGIVVFIPLGTKRIS